MLALHRSTQHADGPAAGAGLPAGKAECLLTACRFFDRELAGYLADEDLEEIGYMVCDSMSSERRGLLVLCHVLPTPRSPAS